MDFLRMFDAFLWEDSKSLGWIVLIWHMSGVCGVFYRF